jgi:hypothetical protein
MGIGQAAGSGLAQQMHESQMRAFVARQQIGLRGVASTSTSGDVYVNGEAVAIKYASIREELQSEVDEWLKDVDI